MADMILVFVILAVTIVLFVLDKLRLDLVALLSLLALMLTGILTVDEALAGFSDSLVLIIAGLFIVGAGLFNTGIAGAVGHWLGQTAGTSEVRVMVLLMLIVALLSAFMSSTGAVAVLLPVVVSLARDARTSPAKLMIPLAYGSLIGGMLTLIGTPPNLVVSEALSEAGMEPFGFFSFTPIGLVILVIGVLYMVFVGRKMLATHKRRRTSSSQDSDGINAVTSDQLADHYHLYDDIYRLRIRRASPLIGQSCEDARIGELYNVTALEIQNWPDPTAQPHPAHRITPETIFSPHDILTVRGLGDDVTQLCRDLDLGIRPKSTNQARVVSTELGLAEVLIRGRSSLVGKTLQDIRFRNKFNVSVLGVMRRNEPITENLGTVRLQFGDALLVQGTWEDIEHLVQEKDDLIVIDIPREMAERKHTLRNGATSVAIVVLMLLAMTMQILPTVTIVLVAAVAMVLTGCVRMEDVYNRINWESVILIAAMLPMATALKKTGGVLFVADALTDSLGPVGILAVMAGLYVITTFFSQFISNTATTVLIAPIAMQAAVTLGVLPHAFLMVVAIAASTAFSTPIASPVNTLVMGPGDYSFSDFAKVGVPLQLIVLVLSLLVIPLMFPLY